jgi:hypothetical protein
MRLRDEIFSYYEKKCRFGEKVQISGKMQILCENTELAEKF